MAELQNSVPAAPSPEEREISSACDHLRTAEKLLLNPDPQAIEHAGFVLQQALSLTETWIATRIAAMIATEQQLTDFSGGCARVKALLEGALRAQWAYIHRMSAATSTYTAGPGTKRCSPRAWTLDLEA